MTTTTAAVPTARRRLHRAGLALVLTAAVIGGGTGAAFAAAEAPTSQARPYGDDAIIAPRVIDTSAPTSMVEEGSGADDSTTGH